MENRALSLPPSWLVDFQLDQPPDLSHAQLHELLCQASGVVRAAMGCRGSGGEHPSDVCCWWNKSLAASGRCL